jgi:hypothetical protein
LQPGFRGDVLAALAAVHPQIAKQPGLKGAPQLEEADLVAGPRPVQSVIERADSERLVGLAPCWTRPTSTS